MTTEAGPGAERRLTGKQRAFAEAYLGNHFNATRAALEAGYGEAGAAVEGVRQLRKANVRAYIDERLRTAAATADEVLAEIADVGLAEWRDFVTVRTLPNGDLDVRMDLGAKVKSLELLAKAHGLLTDKVQMSGELGVMHLVGVDIDAI